LSSISLAPFLIYYHISHDLKRLRDSEQIFFGGNALVLWYIKQHTKLEVCIAKDMTKAKF